MKKIRSPNQWNMSDIDGSNLYQDQNGNFELPLIPQYSSGMTSSSSNYSFLRSSAATSLILETGSPVFQSGGFITGGPSSTEDVEISNSINTTATLAVGKSAQGAINYLGDHDWYKVQLQAGHTYTFAEIGTGLYSLNDTYLAVRDSNGNIISTNDDSGPGTSSVIGMQTPLGTGIFTANYTGSYYIDAGAYGNNSTGQYGISVIESILANGYKPSFDISMGAGALHTDANNGAPLDWNQVNGSTRGNGLNLTYSFRDTLTYLPESTFFKCTTTEMAAISNILLLISDVCGLTFTNIAPGGYSNIGKLVIANYYDPTSAAGAYAYFPSSNQTGGDLWLNTASVNPNSIIQGQYSWFAIMHEFMHAVGLSHPGDYNAGVGTPSYSTSGQFIEDSEQYTIMSYWDGANTGESPGNFATAFTPLLFDISELQKLYGTNTTTRPSDTIYGFNNTAGVNYAFNVNAIPYYCIWDAGGVDTLDASGFSQNQTINICDGYFSNIGAGVSNVSIAVGALIENAVGGGGNDIMVGNNFNNTINGGSGNDILIGNGGNDTIVGGLGTDYACYAYNHTSYAVTYDSGLYTITSVYEGIDSLSGIEYLRCLDGDYLISSFLAGGDYTAPTINTFSPGNDAVGVIADANIVFTFSESITRGTGPISLRSNTATGTIAESFDVASSLLISINGSTLTINPTLNLANGKKYYVTFATGAIKDSAGNSFVDSGTYNFTTGYTGTTANDVLTGTVNVDYFYGLGGNDVITGAAAVDVMNGGEGSDIYIITLPSDHSAAEIADNGSSGVDEVRFAITVAGSTLTLYAGDTGIENVVIGTGTKSAAVSTATISSNINASAVLNGLTIIGNAGINSIIGTAYADTINGGMGADTMTGGGGDDTYIVDNVFDVVTEGANAGTDIINSSVSYTLGSNVENLTLTGTGAINATGNALDNVLTGNSGVNTLNGGDGDDTLYGFAGNDILIGGNGADILYGGLGNDTLTGGNGADQFVFNTALSAKSNIDTITDFLHGTDKIDLENAIMTALGLTTGTLSANQFWSGAGVVKGHDTDDLIVYNTTTGALYYDADGSGLIAPIQIALIGISIHPTLDNQDFLII